MIAKKRGIIVVYEKGRDQTGCGLQPSHLAYAIALLAKNVNKPITGANLPLSIHRPFCLFFFFPLVFLSSRRNFNIIFLYEIATLVREYLR